MQDYKWKDLIAEVRGGSVVYFYWMGVKYSLKVAFDWGGKKEVYYINRELDGGDSQYYCHVDNWWDDKLYVSTFVFSNKCTTHLRLSEIKLEREYEVVG